MQSTVIRRWESARRYYCAMLHQDLLGDYVVDRFWGGRFNRLGGHDTKPVASLEHGLVFLDQLNAERVSKKYVHMY